MENSLKFCSGCYQIKSIDEFHKKQDSPDGLRSKCKSCRKIEGREYRSRPGKKEEARIRVYNWRMTEKGSKSCKKTKKAYYSTEDGKIRNRNDSSNQRAKHPKRILARKRLWWAVASGKIKRPLSCEICGSIKSIEAHHYMGYDKKHWYDVKWLCKDCHSKEDLCLEE